MNTSHQILLNISCGKLSILCAIVVVMLFPFGLPWSRHRSVCHMDEANIASGLQNLPPELLHMIALQLPHHDAAAFALINRRFSIVLDSTYWPSLRNNSCVAGHLNIFLITIARDLSSWFHCHLCLHLHPRDRVLPSGPWNWSSQPLRRLSTSVQSSLWRFVHVHGGIPAYFLDFIICS